MANASTELIKKQRETLNLQKKIFKAQAELTKVRLEVQRIEQIKKGLNR